MDRDQSKGRPVSNVKAAARAAEWDGAVAAALPSSGALCRTPASPGTTRCSTSSFRARLVSFTALPCSVSVPGEADR